MIVNTFSQSDALWQDVYARALTFRPVLVVGYVSSLEAFADYLLRTKQTIPGVKCAIAAAEPLYEATRVRIEQALSRAALQFVGSREFMSIAAECGCRDGLHVHAENLVVETRDRHTDTPSEILVTDLHNYGMPFVRYETGDLGRVVHTACQCGRGLPRLEAIRDASWTRCARLTAGPFRASSFRIC